MADVQAFRAYRYDLARVGALSDVVAPPYDVIDPGLQEALYARSAYNVIRLILNKETPADSESNNRYTRSAQFLRDWQREGVLVQDSARGLYVYHQEFVVEGKRYERKGFLARVRLEKFGEGRTFAHEETMPGPKADRLKLFQATNMNLSPVFGLYPDDEGKVQAALESAIRQALPREATDHLGVVHRLWPVSDQAVVSSVTGLMGPKAIFIADGHHRYETALKYLDERRQAGEASGPDHPANFVLMMLVAMSDPGLAILPTHRLISGVDGLSADRLKKMLQSNFDVHAVGTGSSAARQTWEMIDTDGDQGLLGLGTVLDGRWQLARFRSPELMAQLAPEHSPAWGALGVSILHRLLLDKLLPEAGYRSAQCRYVHLLREVEEAIEQKECQLVALVPPARMKDVATIARNLEKMPPKSTYFYPKLLSGLVLHSLKAN